MVGPDFHKPASPQTFTYNEHKLPKKTVSTAGVGKAGKSQEYVTNLDIPSDWWVLFKSPVINQLVRAGIANSPNLAAAYAALRQAQENFNVQFGNSMLPAFNGNGLAERQLYSSAGFNNQFPSFLFNLFNVNVSVSYTFDIFGGARRQLEALAAQVDYQQFQLIAAYLSITSNIVTTAITIASLQDQIETTHQIIKVEQAQLDILNKQYQLGGVALSNVMTQQTLVAQARATLPPLEKSLSQNRHALAVLIGTTPNTEIPGIRLSTLDLPKRMPVSLPSNMVRQRPDVRASEALLHAASAQIGVATANLLPQFSLTGNYGWESVVPSRLFGTSTNTWNITGNLLQPIFHGGALLAQRRAAIAAYDQAFAQYKQVVLQALQNVADSLRALETDARTLHAQKAAEKAAQSNLNLTQKQYRLGGVNYLNLLNAEQQFQQTKLNLIQAEAARYTDAAALFQALGGGWWNNVWCIKECL